MKALPSDRGRLAISVDRRRLSEGRASRDASSRSRRSSRSASTARPARGSRQRIFSFLEVDAAFAASSPPPTRTRFSTPAGSVAASTSCATLWRTRLVAMGILGTSWGLAASDEIVQQGQLHSSTATLPKNRSDRRRCVIGHRWYTREHFHCKLARDFCSFERGIGSE